MKNYEELTIDLINYYKKKYNGELIVKTVEYKTTFNNDNHVPKLKNVFEIYVVFSFLTLDVYSWNIPHDFSSKVSFENAIKMLKIAVNGYLDSLMVEKDFVELDFNNIKLIELFSKDISLLSNDDFSFIIDNYVKKEDFEGAAKYMNLKNKHIKE